jgi:hypothetical protein
MAYIIGNTTVIDNNAALGAVDGNSVNLANNNNIPAGGASTGFFSSTTNQAVVGSSLAFIIGSGGGGGGARNTQNFQSYAPAGGSGRTGIAVADVSAGGNATYNVGAGGNAGPASYNNSGGTGGTSGISHTQTFNFPGGNGGAWSGNPQSTGSTPAPGFAGPGLSNTGTNSNVIYDGYGAGGNGGRYYGQNNPGQSGFLFTIG